MSKKNSQLITQIFKAVVECTCTLSLSDLKLINRDKMEIGWISNQGNEKASTQVGIAVV